MVNIQFDLDLFLEHIRQRAGRAGTVTLERLAEVRPLQAISHDELVAAAACHGLRCTPLLHGAAFQFTQLPAD